MFYYIYEIKNNINNKIYVGIHKTKNLNDNYMGSGKLIKNAIKKYGIKNFCKKILMFCKNYEELLKFEKLIVNESFINNKNTYNLKNGGIGGFEYINNNENINKFKGKKHTKETKQKIGNKIKTLFNQKEYKLLFSNKMIGNNRNPKIKEKGKNHPAFGKSKSKLHKEKISNRIKKLHENNFYNKKNCLLFRKGSEHPAYGSVWICNKKTKENKKVKKEILEEFLNSGWERGRIL